MKHVRRYLLALTLSMGCLLAICVPIASAAPAAQVTVIPNTSGYQCTNSAFPGNASQCGQVVGSGLSVSYLHWGLYNKFLTSRWCGFIEVVEETSNRAWSAVQYTGTICSNGPGGVIGNLAIYRTMPAQGSVYEYAIPAAGSPSMGVNVFNVY